MYNREGSSFIEKKKEALRTESRDIEINDERFRNEFAAFLMMNNNMTHDYDSSKIYTSIALISCDTSCDMRGLP